MKKNLIISTVLIAIMVMFINVTPAQATEIGFTGGLNLANMTGETSEAFEWFSSFDDSKSMLAFGGGTYTRLRLVPQFSIHAEALYMQKGTKWEGVDGAEDEKLTLTYVEIPILLMFNPPMTGPMSPCVFAGPYFGYLTDATDKVDGEDIDVSGMWKDLDFGVVFGAGVDIKMGPSGKLFLNGRYSKGLTKVNDFLTDDISIKNNTISFFVGYSMNVGP